jgi:hypothetical protein
LAITGEEKNLEMKPNKFSYYPFNENSKSYDKIDHCDGKSCEKITLEQFINAYFE